MTIRNPEEDFPDGGLGPLNTASEETTRSWWGPLAIVAAIGVTELLLWAGGTLAVVAPLLVLASAFAAATSFPLSLITVSTTTVYAATRAVGLGYTFLDPEVIVLLVATGLFGPGLVVWLQKLHTRTRLADTERVRREFEEHFDSQLQKAALAAESDRRVPIDGLEVIVWESRPDGGGFRFLNTYAETLLGYSASADDPLDLPWEITHPDDLRRLQSTVAMVLEDGQPRQLEYRIQGKDGFSVWVRDYIRRIPGSGPENPLVRGMALDVSARKAVEEDLHREKERYRSLFEGVPVGLYRMSPQGEFLMANNALVSMMGYSNHQAFYATSASELYADPMDRWRWQNSMVHVHGVRSFELPCRRADGTLIRVRNTARAVRNEDGEIAWYEGFVEDVSDETRFDVTEENAESSYRGLVEQSLVGIFMVQGEKVLYANPKVSEIFGYSHSELLGLPSALALVVDEHREKVADYLREQIDSADGDPLGFRGLRKDGTVIDLEVHCSQTTFNGLPAVLGTVLDVTSRKATEERLFQAAFHDPLTGLPNRILFMERLEHAFQRQKRGKQFAVLFLDMNRFKAINDSYGHSTGDELLRVVAHRMETCVRPGDTIARFGGDEFGLLIEDITQAEDATEIAGRIRDAIGETVEINGHEIHAAVSIGIALSSAGYRTPEEILRDADLAMYRAKGTGDRSRFEIFDQAMHGEVLERIELENDLQVAAERGDFHLHFQPIVDLRSGEMAGVEALVRWTHASRGAVQPATFIPLAEETGIIIPIGRQVLRMACRQLADWQKRFPRELPLSVSVNLSAKQIRGSAIVEDVRELLEETGLAPGSLQLEITEGLILEDQRAAAHMLNRLKALGVRIYLDDFGTGYSSLGYLHSLPIDSIKIDRTFINRLELQDASGPHLVRTIVNVAHTLGMEVIAEGAETIEHVRRLQDLGCEFAQGHHFAPAVPAEEIEGMLRMGRFELPDNPSRLRVVVQN